MSEMRPVSILIAAMGGEGGAVLAEWIVDAATAAGLPVQSTSVPGVAQRTGATTYYVEVYPERWPPTEKRQPVMSLTPTPGHVDLVAASELVEAGRMLQGGFVSAARTLLVASTHREYATAEKIAMGDGRYDSQRVLDAARACAQHAVLFDMRTLAAAQGSVINTVLFGAMAGSGALPLPRAACEAAIRRSGKAVEASLRGFAAGFEHARAAAAPSAAAMPALQTFEQVLTLGENLTADYQDAAYARLYRDRVAALQAAAAGEASAQPALREAARFLALWMCYDDVIRVADLKTRRERIERVRREVGAGAAEPLQLTEYLRPGLDEVCAMLPPALAAWVRARESRFAPLFGRGLRLRTDTLRGFALLCLLRAMRRWRPRLSRHAVEQAAIERWLRALQQALPRSAELALEVALAGNLIKGYGDTHRRGHRHLSLLLDEVESGRQPDPLQLAQRLRSGRAAALADPSGHALADTLGRARPLPVAQPIRFVRRRETG